MQKINKRYTSPVLWFLMAVAAIGLFDSIGPPEKTLGTNARVVYLHGVWVWASLLTLLAAGLAGLAASQAARWFHNLEGGSRFDRARMPSSRR
jgi:hypothetical protein